MVWRDGERIIKRFRRKPGLTSDLISPYVSRFVKNARRLRDRGIGAPEIIGQARDGLFGDAYLVYERVPGRPASDLGDSLAPETMGNVYASLHQAGVLFRSLHLSNILLQEAGEFGLIDITDVKFDSPPLPIGDRAKNLGYAWSHPRDAEYFTDERLSAIIQAYVEASKLEGAEATQFDEAVRGEFESGRARRLARRARKAAG